MIPSGLGQMAISIGRRRFISALGGAAMTWPLAARTQPVSKVWRIAILETTSKELNARNLAAFYKGLRDLGYVEGQNLVVDYRSSDGRNERLQEYASELARLRPDAIVVRGTPQALAAMAVSGAIPIVMTAIADPVGSGLVANLAHPGGNVTGLSSFHTELEAKRLELLTEMAPGLKRIATLRDFSNPTTTVQWEQLQSAAITLRIDIHRYDIRNANDIKLAFDAATKQGIDALDVGIDTVTATNQRFIVDLAATNKLLAIYAARDFVENGGLLGYGVNYPDLYFRSASYLDKIFKGASPKELPVEQPTKLDLTVNLKTAKMLGLTVPQALLAIADEVIE